VKDRLGRKLDIWSNKARAFVGMPMVAQLKVMNSNNLLMTRKICKTDFVVNEKMETKVKQQKDETELRYFIRG
jgi:hypothetical protein